MQHVCVFGTLTASFNKCLAAVRHVFAVSPNDPQSLYGHKSYQFPARLTFLDAFRVSLPAKNIEHVFLMTTQVKPCAHSMLLLWIGFRLADIVKQEYMTSLNSTKNYIITEVQWYFHMVLFIHYVVLTFDSVDEILWCYHLNETSSAVLSRGIIYLVCSSNFWCCGWNPMVLPSKWNLFSSTFTWYYLFSM